MRDIVPTTNARDRDSAANMSLQLSFVDYSHMRLDIEWPLMCNIQTLTLCNHVDDHADPNCDTVYSNIAQYCANLKNLHFDFTIVNISQLTVIVEQCGLLRLLALRMLEFNHGDVVQQWLMLKPELAVCDVSDLLAVNVFEV